MTSMMYGSSAAISVKIDSEYFDYTVKILSTLEMLKLNTDISWGWIHLYRTKQ